MPGAHRHLRDDQEPSRAYGVPRLLAHRSSAATLGSATRQSPLLTVPVHRLLGRVTLPTRIDHGDGRAAPLQRQAEEATVHHIRRVSVTAQFARLTPLPTTPTSTPRKTGGGIEDGKPFKVVASAVEVKKNRLRVELRDHIAALKESLQCFN